MRKQKRKIEIKTTKTTIIKLSFTHIRFTWNTKIMKTEPFPYSGNQ